MKKESKGQLKTKKLCKIRKKLRTGRKCDNIKYKEVNSNVVPVFNYALGNEGFIGELKDSFTHSLSGQQTG